VPGVSDAKKTVCGHHQNLLGGCQSIWQPPSKKTPAPRGRQLAFRISLFLAKTLGVHDFAYLGKHFPLFFFHSMMLDIFNQDFELRLKLLAI
jgi:hypothetical protein